MAKMAGRRRRRTYIVCVCVRTEGNPDLLAKHRIGDVDVASAIHVQGVFFSVCSIISIPCMVGYIGYSLYASLVNAGLVWLINTRNSS